MTQFSMNLAARVAEAAVASSVHLACGAGSASTVGPGTVVCNA
jgi:hypothetical protein